MAAYIGDNLPTSWALQGATQTSLHNRWLPTWSGTTVCMPHKAQFDQKRRSRADTHELTAIAFVAFGLVGVPGIGIYEASRLYCRPRTCIGRRGCVWLVRAGFPPPASRQPRADTFDQPEPK